MPGNNTTAASTWVGGSRPLSRVDSTGTALFVERQNSGNFAFNGSCVNTHTTSHASYVHRNRASFAFADGHVATLTEAESCGSGSPGAIITTAKGVWTVVGGD
jgi:prepilin-type processing-associated H-X9-DG protein